MTEPDIPRTPILRRPLLSWIAGFTEPLLDPARRDADEAELSLMVERWPDYMALCFAGFLAGAAATLPPEDPWRSMTPRRGRELGGRDEWTGADLPNGQRFGDWRCAVDLTPLIVGLDPEHDPSLVALATPLEPIGALLTAAAARSLAEVNDLCAELRHRAGLHDRPAADPSGHDSGQRRPVDYAGPYLAPLRWLLHRRRAYFGTDDHFFVVWAPAWIERARRILDEDRPVELELPQEPDTLASLVAPAGSYEELTQGLMSWPEQ